jgi:N-acetyl-anhydromuramyl-L-alanine amidase AmpD
MIRAKTGSEQMSDLIRAASRDAALQVVERAKQTSTHVIVERDGQIVRLSAEEADNELKRSLTITSSSS